MHFLDFPVFIKGKVRNESLSLEVTKFGFEIFKKVIAELSQNLVRLSSVEDEAFWEELQVIGDLEQWLTSMSEWSCLNPQVSLNLGVPVLLIITSFTTFCSSFN